MDKPTAHQKALPTRVFQKLYDLCLTSQDFAIAWLIIGAMFFVMHSCEYSMTKTWQISGQGQSELRTSAFIRIEDWCIIMIPTLT